MALNDNLLIIFLIVYVSVYITFIIRQRDKRAEKKNTFFRALTEGLKTGSIVTIDDVVNVYKGVFGLSSENSSYRYSLSKLLREFLVDVISKKQNVTGGPIEDKIIMEWKKKLSEFIQQNEENSPYAELPIAERNALNDISMFIEKQEAEPAKRKILELAGMIQARNDDLNKIRSTNKWSVPLSIVGIIFTVIFGILALK